LASESGTRFAYSPDFTVEAVGMVALLKPRTPQGRRWAEAHIGPDRAPAEWWDAIVVEGDYLPPILEGIEESGLTWGAVQPLSRAA
jgi:hypothetical protein